MATLSSLQFLLFTLLALVLDVSSYASEEERQVYIVYMGALPEGEHFSHPSYHMDMLQQVVHASFVSQSMVRSYTRSFNAFAANLTFEEREKLAGFGEVVSIFPSRTLRTQTTRSWDFIGFHEDVDRQLTTESDIIVGLIDTGVWPKSESFNDEGFGPPPKKWKGECRGGKNFTCNRKLIGARYYSATDSAIDELGHGTHTASTATGRKVKHASFYGLGEGTARGGVPSARIAAYKACSPLCFDTDILAAFDDAIADGVDIISISISYPAAVDIKFDTIAIGAFHAMQKGILTVQSAGNDGPKPGSTASVVPWVFSVGASTIDRLFIDKVALGNGHVITGSAIDTVKRSREAFPLVYGKEVTSNCSDLDSQKCAAGCLNTNFVRNKILICSELADSTEAYEAGVAGIIKKTAPIYPPFVVPFTESRLTPDEFVVLLNYINTSKRVGRTPEAYISATETVRDQDAPAVSGFSSRGPNTIIPDILKPDVVAPGSAILAAYPPLVTPSTLIDKRSVNFSILSGTSMSCPHVTGAAAYVKSFHPNWSPSAIKSALMTTARPLKDKTTAGDVFGYGAGLIEPAKAVNPGLVYDSSTDNYIQSICGLGYNTSTLRMITGDNSSSCPPARKAETRRDYLNYPTMAAKVNSTKPFLVKFVRKVTNVGVAKSTYKARVVKSSDNVVVVVKPGRLKFGKLNERKSFVVTVKGKISGGSIVRALLQWSDGTHRVRSPIVVYDDSALHDQH